MKPEEITKLTENTQCSNKTQDIFKKIMEEFVRLMQEKPTGEFGLSIIINQGGIRGKPRIIIKKDLQ